MNQVDKPENTDPTPKPSDAEPSSYASWKQLSTVLSSIKASTDLSTSERDTLIQMITSEDPTLINTIRSCESQDLLSAQLLTLARSRLAGEANGTASTSSSSASTDTSSASSSSTSTTTEDVTMSTESDSTNIPSTPPTKSLATSASSPPPTSPTEAAFKTALTTMSNDKKRYESCIKALYKTLTALKKKPGLITNRKMRMDNIAVKKMMEVPGASTFMETVGFTQTTPSATDQKTPIYLQIEKEEDIRHDILDQAIEKLEHAIAIVEGRQTSTGEVKAPEPPKPSGPRVRCQGAGCNFFGDESTENLCSVCYKKKYFGTPTSTSMTPTPAKAPVAPLVTVLRCKSGCGFVGIESYGGQCSVCYKKDKEGKEPPKRWRRHLHSASIKLRAIRLFNAGKRPAQTNKNRCYTCGKRVGITGIECRCSYIFCGKHRYPQEHECPFDYKNLQRKKLAKENEMITRKKMDKIGE